MTHDTAQFAVQAILRWWETMGQARYTTTKAGLTVACELDTTEYAKGNKVPDAEMNTLAITRNDFHPEWNYTIAPRSKNHALILA